jgi:fibro-slime domain-containing protein
MQKFRVSFSRPAVVMSLLVGGALFVGCSREPELTSGTGAGGKLIVPEDDSLDIVNGVGGADGAGSETDGGTIEILKTLPKGFTAADGNGGYKLIGTLKDVGATAEEGCANVLRAVVRDFSKEHEDFEEGSSGLTFGMLDSELGTDRKPVYSASAPNGDKVTSADSFAEWYRNVDGTNQPFVVDLWLEPVGSTFVLDSTSFFPIDEVGFPEDHEAEDGKMHRFHFTTELHTKFEYKGGEEFTFRGDDDVWVFINGQLAIDIGGVHAAEEGSVALDEKAEELGLTVGKVYDFDLFQAERQTIGSNFRIETTLDFTECGTVLDGDVVK